MSIVVTTDKSQNAPEWQIFCNDGRGRAHDAQSSSVHIDVSNGAYATDA